MTKFEQIQRQKDGSKPIFGSRKLRYEYLGKRKRRFKKSQKGTRKRVGSLNINEHGLPETLYYSICYMFKIAETYEQQVRIRARKGDYFMLELFGKYEIEARALIKKLRNESK